MAVIEPLSEEECYLLAILDDVSGLDLAEFTWMDMDRDDLCWRAYPFQWAWWREKHRLTIDQCARAIGKTTSIVLRAYAFPFLFPKQEMLITAPELIHLEPLTSLVIRRFGENRIGREMLPMTKSSIKQRPFQINFANGSRIIGRIPQRDGKGVKGMHPIWLEQDEAQDYPAPGWTELVETLRRGLEGASWRAHGVTRGLRDKFYDFTNPNDPENPFKVFRITAMHRPDWTDQERQEKIKQYGGSREHPDYRRNVLGLHGDTQNPLFVLHRLMRCVDDDQTSPYNTEEYTHFRINNEMLLDREGNVDDIINYLPFPEQHKKDYQNFWIGMDVGYTNDPSEILVFAEYRKTKAAASTLKLITRVHLERISNPQQCQAIIWMMDFYRPKAFSLDKTGVGLPLFQDLQHMAPGVANQIKGYNFSSKILVDFDQSVDVKEGEDDVKKAGIEKQVLEYATDVLRDLVDNERLHLPWDRDLLGEFQGQTWTYSKESMDMYGRRRRVFSQGAFHALDAARMAVLGWKQETIEELMRLREQDSPPVFDYLFVA